MPEHITKADESILERMAGKGMIHERESEIDDVEADFDLEDFPDLRGEELGDKVLVVMSGYVSDTDDEAIEVTFNRAAVVHGKMPKLGSGARFAALERELSKKPGIHDPAALAASIGRKKFGKVRFQKLSAAGRRKG